MSTCTCAFPPPGPALTPVPALAAIRSVRVTAIGHTAIVNSCHVAYEVSDWYRHGQPRSEECDRGLCACPEISESRFDALDELQEAVLYAIEAGIPCVVMHGVRVEL